MQILNERLVTRRHALNLSQSELAEKAGVSERTIAAYETGEGKPTYRSIQKIADALEVKVAYLMDEEEGSALVLKDEMPAPSHNPAIPAKLFPTPLLSEVVKVFASLVPLCEGRQRAELMEGLNTAIQELDRRPKARVSSTAISAEEMDAADVAAQAADRLLAESSAPSRVGAHKKGGSESPPRSSSPAKTARPGPPKPDKV